MQVQNTNPVTDDSALSLSVQPGEAPMRVNSTGKVVNLNADRLDGTDSSSLGTLMATSQSVTKDCAGAGQWRACATQQVRVPAGKEYDVTVSSSVNAASSTAGELNFCPAIEGGPFGLSCITPTPSTGKFHTISLAANYSESGASSGEIRLTAGTYTVSTAVRPTVALADNPPNNVHTTLMVQYASAPAPPTQ